MSINSIYTYVFIIFNLIITLFFIRRAKLKGCMSFGYVFLIIFCITLFSFSVTPFFIKTTQENYDVFTSGEDHVATVVGIVNNGVDSNNSTMYSPIVEFKTLEGKTITKQLGFSSKGIKTGETYKVNYNPQKDRVITLGYIRVITVVGAILFFTIFIFLFAGLMLYILNFSMKGYFYLIKLIGLKFFFPFVMIMFDALLIYALFYGNKIPIGISILLVFFILILTLGIVGYIKMFFTESKFKNKKAKPLVTFSNKKKQKRINR